MRVELEVIRGAKQTLKETAFVIAETSVQERFDGSYRFFEFVSEMESLGFKIGNILTAHPDRNGIVRFMDILYLPKA